jgi:pilus assembly protein CpaB
MKLGIIGLIVLGLVAAACAAVLVNGMHAASALSPSTRPDDNPDVIVMYVTRAVPSMTVIDGSMVTTKTMKRNDAPKGYVTNPSDIVGKVVSEPLVGGQPFLKAYFADENSPHQLASVIPAGKRAVGISVTDYAGLEGLIYPGSMVDVMVSFKADASSQEFKRDAVTTTLLENVQVLAFEQQTVVSPGKMLGDAESGMKGSGMRRVTLLVDTKQSKALEMGMAQGTLSLALRNPLDASAADKDAVSVRSIMGDDFPINQPKPAVKPDMSDPFAKQPAASTAVATVQPDQSKLQWDTIVIHGDTSETKSFTLPQGDAHTPVKD